MSMNAILAAILSLFIPGLGQALSGDITKGVMYFIGLLIILAIAHLVFRHWIVTVINIFYRLYVAYDAYQMNQYAR